MVGTDAWCGRPGCKYPNPFASMGSYEDGTLNARLISTLSSEPRTATIGRALGALEGRGEVASGVVMNPTDFWEMVTEGLGTAYAGGWAADPVGAAPAAPTTSPAPGASRSTVTRPSRRAPPSPATSPR